MLSVVIATENAERVLLPTLAALVPGAAAGVVREVILADAGSRDATLEIADVAGCRVLTLPSAPLGARLRSAAGAARAPWLLFLRPGSVPEAGWTGETARFVEQCELTDRTQTHAAMFRRGGDDMNTPLADALLALRAALLAGARPEQGLLIHKRFYERIGGHAEARGDTERHLLRRIGRRLVTLRCPITMVA